MFFYLSVNGPFFGVGVISGSSRGHLGGTRESILIFP
jgi:hypothetical protein